MEATRSSETPVYNKPTRRYILEDGILHSHRRENLKSYITFIFLFFNCDFFKIFVGGGSEPGPNAYSVSKMSEKDAGVVLEIIGDFQIGPSANVLEWLGKIPVVHGNLKHE
jgi:hypothetical protein